MCGRKKGSRAAGQGFVVDWRCDVFAPGSYKIVAVVLSSFEVIMGNVCRFHKETLSGRRVYGKNYENLLAFPMASCYNKHICEYG
jgi:hypothetical protein